MAPVYNMPNHHLSRTLARDDDDHQSWHLSAPETAIDVSEPRTGAKTGIKRFLRLPRNPRTQTAAITSPRSVPAVASVPGVASDPAASSAPSTERNDGLSLDVKHKHWSQRVLQIVGKPSNGKLHGMNWVRRICYKHTPKSVAEKQETSSQLSIALSWNSGDDAQDWSRRSLKEVEEVFSNHQNSLRALPSVRELTSVEDIFESQQHGDAAPSWTESESDDQANAQATTIVEVIFESTQHGNVAPSQTETGSDEQDEAQATTTSIDINCSKESGEAAFEQDHDHPALPIERLEDSNDHMEAQNEAIEQEDESDLLQDNIQPLEDQSGSKPSQDCCSLVSAEHKEGGGCASSSSSESDLVTPEDEPLDYQSGSEQHEDCCSLVSAECKESGGCVSSSSSEPGFVTPEDEPTASSDPKTAPLTLESRFGCSQEKWDEIGERMKKMIDEYDTNPEPLDNHFKAVSEIMDRYAPQFDKQPSTHAADKASSHGKASSVANSKGEKKMREVRKMDSTPKIRKTSAQSTDTPKSLATAVASSAAEASEKPVTSTPRDSNFGFFTIPDEHKAPAQPSTEKPDKISSKGKASSVANNKGGKKKRGVKKMDSTSKARKTSAQPTDATKPLATAVASSVTNASEKPIFDASRDVSFGSFTVPDEYKTSRKPAFNFDHFSAWQKTVPASLQIPVKQPLDRVAEEGAQRTAQPVPNPVEPSSAVMKKTRG